MKNSTISFEILLILYKYIYILYFLYNNKYIIKNAIIKSKHIYKNLEYFFILWNKIKPKFYYT